MRVPLLLRIAVFVAAFSVEVRVKADMLQLPAGSARIEEPEGCWTKSAPCAVKTSANEKQELKLGESTVVLDQSTAIIRVSANEIRLVSGTVWIKAGEPVTVATEFGSFSTELGELWVWRNALRANAATIEGKVILKARGSKEDLELASGLENWLSRVGPDGQAQTGVPMAIELKSHLLRWARLYSGSRISFEKEALAFHDKWTQAADEAALIHKELFDRKVASLRTEAVARSDAQKKVEVRNRELRDRLWKHVFEE